MTLYVYRLSSNTRPIQPTPYPRMSGEFRGCGRRGALEHRIAEGGATLDFGVRDMKTARRSQEYQEGRP